jgi:hypothetical protein
VVRDISWVVSESSGIAFSPISGGVPGIAIIADAPLIVGVAQNVNSHVPIADGLSRFIVDISERQRPVFSCFSFIHLMIESFSHGENAAGQVDHSGGHL